MTTPSSLTDLQTRETRQFASEIKFAVNADLAQRIRAWARVHLAADPHASGPSGDEYRVTSLYLDTQDLDVLYRRRSFGRAKYRVRRYGSAATVFLERKLRTSRLIAKRRTGIDLDALAHLDDVADANSPGLWFRRRIEHRRLGPVCQISYHRLARVGTSEYGPIRLTLDDRLHAATADGLEFRDGLGARVLEDRLILELKYRIVLPPIFRRLVEEFALRPERRSKYRLAMDALGCDVDAAADSSAASRGLSLA